MLEIFTENFVSNYFLQHPEANDVSMKELRELKSDIENNLWKKKIHLYIWTTRHDIFSLIDLNPNIFAWENDKLSLKDRDQAIILAEQSNAQLDPIIRDTYLELIKTLCQK